MIRQLDVRRASGGRYEVSTAMPRFGIRTLRCEFGGRVMIQRRTGLWR